MDAKVKEVIQKQFDLVKNLDNGLRRITTKNQVVFYMHDILCVLYEIGSINMFEWGIAMVELNHWRKKED